MRLFASLLTSTLALVQVNAALGSFDASCQSITYTKSGSDIVLAAGCAKSNGTYYWTTISLNSCIGNFNGQLNCGSGYASSCSTCNILNGNNLECQQCKDTSENLKRSVSWLPICIRNEEGTLKCH
ncbi:Cyanovirin-N [Exidia glandulosa HHB12029]|uniref:Cyanovirin-N n=1 Tax=Exidia glandulosa HHB12029 TaxID=1314781 RepID=A0A165DQ32_EXIGL|nr:Cyanovirin-N [Exidia glandulosa HHB12029]